jgi:hypothetical protein
LVDTRTRALARTHDPSWRELFDRADSVSEGALKAENQGQVWYGSTSLILPLDETISPGTRAFFAAVAAQDPHVRLRAVRTACREASLRAPAPLGCFTCEIRVEGDSRGVRIDVDVQAPLIGGRARRGAHQ